MTTDETTTFAEMIPTVPALVESQIRTVEQLDARIRSYFDEETTQGLAIVHEALKRSRGLSTGVISRDDPLRLDGAYFCKLMEIVKNNRSRTIRKLLQILEPDCFVSFDMKENTCEFTYEGFIEAVICYSNPRNKPHVKKMIKAVRKYNVKAGKLVLELLDYLEMQKRRLVDQNRILRHENNKLLCHNTALSKHKLSRMLWDLKLGNCWLQPGKEHKMPPSLNLLIDDLRLLDLGIVSDEAESHKAGGKCASVCVYDLKAFHKHIRENWKFYFTRAPKKTRRFNL